MENSYLISGATVFDGSNTKPKFSDILIENGLIKAIENSIQVDSLNVKHIDASGKWVLPGFIDNHTHYDAEIAISPGLKESVRHGVTSVIIGSCSVSFIASDAEDCSDLFTRVESVPREFVLPLLQNVKTWNRPSQWLDFVNTLSLGPNIASFLGHSDIRVKTMGLSRAVNAKEKPTKQEQLQMESYLNEALDIGFLGLSTMTNPWDKLDGNREWSKQLPSSYATWKEYRRFNKILRKRNAILQSAPNLVTRLNALLFILESSGIFRKKLKTTLIAMIDSKADPYILNLTRALSFLGNNILNGDFRWQAPPCPFEVFADGMDLVVFEEFPTGQAVRDLAKDLEKRDLLISSQKYRNSFKKEYQKKLAPKVWHRDFADAYVLDAPDKSLIGHSFDAIAKERNQNSVDTFLDLILDHHDEIRWHTVVGNHRPEKYPAIFNHRGNLIGFSDAGAHLRNMAFYSFPLRMLNSVKQSHKKGKPIMSYQKAIHRLTGEQADWFGLDAGYIKLNKRADLLVLNPDNLDARVDKIHEAPFEGLSNPEKPYLRCVNRSDGVIDHVFINGVEVWKKNKFTEGYGANFKTGKFLEMNKS